MDGAETEVSTEPTLGVSSKDIIYAKDSVRAKNHSALQRMLVATLQCKPQTVQNAVLTGETTL